MWCRGPILVLLVMTGLALGTKPSLADPVIYDNGVALANTNFFSASFAAETTGSQFQIADDFILSSDSPQWSITGADWAGSLYEEVSGIFTLVLSAGIEFTFDLLIFEDDGSGSFPTGAPLDPLPGTAIAHRKVVATGRGTDPGVMYSASFDPIVLDAQKQYWFMVAARGLFTCDELADDCIAWGAAGRASTGNAVQGGSNFSATWINQSRQQLFSLRGTSCLADETTACLNNNRFTVKVEWETATGTGPGTVAPGGTDDSANLWFFSPNNWELLIKVLDGCGINNHFWVFFAATTDQGFTVTVTDRESGAVKKYLNPLGQPANAVTDTTAFATCP